MQCPCASPFGTYAMVSTTRSVGRQEQLGPQYRAKVSRRGRISQQRVEVVSLDRPPPAWPYPLAELPSRAVREGMARRLQRLSPEIEVEASLTLDGTYAPTVVEQLLEPFDLHVTWAAAWAGTRYDLRKGLLTYPPMDEVATYVEEHGVQVYGLIVTGYVSELQRLQEQPWAAALEVRELLHWLW